jgi:hypothetical protein
LHVLVRANLNAKWAPQSSKAGQDTQEKRRQHKKKAYPADRSGRLNTKPAWPLGRRNGLTTSRDHRRSKAWKPHNQHMLDLLRMMLTTFPRKVLAYAKLLPIPSARLLAWDSGRSCIRANQGPRSAHVGAVIGRGGISEGFGQRRLPRWLTGSSDDEKSFDPSTPPT